MSTPAATPTASRQRSRWLVPAVAVAGVILVAATALTTWLLTRDDPAGAATSLVGNARAQSACEHLQSVPATMLDDPDRLVYVVVNAREATGPVHDIGVELGVQVDTAQQAVGLVRDRAVQAMVDTAMRMLVVCSNEGYKAQ